MRIDNTLSERAQLAWFQLRGLVVAGSNHALHSAIAVSIGSIGARYPDTTSALIDLQPARQLYRALGIDPSKRRPSSEALLRRVIQGKALYEVNNAVDCANLCSLSVLLPVGLYDVDKLSGEPRDLTFRLGLVGESYEGIGKGTISATDKPVLADAAGPFGNPSADSFRTSVGEGTKHLLFVLYAPVSYPELSLRLDHCKKSMTDMLGGEIC